MKAYILTLFCFLALASCNSKIASEEDPEPDPPAAESGLADIVSVSVSGQQNSYQFAVGISSPDEDCDQYANWWEIVSPDSSLIYRRILAHSHPTEQPFVRSGGPVEIGPNDTVIIRAHMHPGGYGGVVYEGSVSAGFEAMQKPADFAAELSEKAPLPTVCTG